MKNEVTNRISGTSLSLIVLLVAMGIFSMVRVYNSHNSINEVARIDIPLIEAMINIETHQLEQSINFERAVRFAEEIGKYDNAKENFNLADSLFRKLALLVDQELLEAERHVKAGIDEASTDSQRITMKDLFNELKKMEREHLGYERDALAVLGLLIKADVAQAIEKVTNVQAKEEKFNKQVERVLIQTEQYTEKVVKSIEKQEKTTLQLVVLLTCFFIMISIVISFIANNKVLPTAHSIGQGGKTDS